MKELYKNTYCDESLADVDRDVSEAFDSDFNPNMKDIPENKGTYTVTITWELDD